MSWSAVSTPSICFFSNNSVALGGAVPLILQHAPPHTVLSRPSRSHMVLAMCAATGAPSMLSQEDVTWMFWWARIGAMAPAPGETDRVWARAVDSAERASLRTFEADVHPAPRQRLQLAEDAVEVLPPHLPRHLCLLRGTHRLPRRVPGDTERRGHGGRRPRIHQRVCHRPVLDRRGLCARGSSCLPGETGREGQGKAGAHPTCWPGGTRRHGPRPGPGTRGRDAPGHPGPAGLAWACGRTSGPPRSAPPG